MLMQLFIHAKEWCKLNGYITTGGVQVGTGTAIESIVRLHDEYSYYKLKGASNQLEYTKYMASTLQEIAQRFPDLQNTEF